MLNLTSKGSFFILVSTDYLRLIAYYHMHELLLWKSNSRVCITPVFLMTFKVSYAFPLTSCVSSRPHGDVLRELSQRCWAAERLNSNRAGRQLRGKSSGHHSGSRTLARPRSRFFPRALPSRRAGTGGSSGPARTKGSLGTRE